jgi:hypothetical protein
MLWQNPKFGNIFFEELYVCTQNATTLMSRRLQNHSIKSIAANYLTPKAKQL